MPDGGSFDRNHLFIGGSWEPPSTPELIEIANPATEKHLGTVPAAGPQDVDKAVAAASSALEVWRATPADQRAEALSEVSRTLAQRVEQIATVIASEVGTPLSQARLIQAATAAGTFASAAVVTSQTAFSERIGSSILFREPVGVVGAITPWNYPLQQLAAKVAFALGAGATVVAKPSEIAPLASFFLAEAVEQAGLPPGVFNLVTGTGSVAGEALVSHPGISMISFTGSSANGARVASRASGKLSRIALELGGKSAALVLGDGDLSKAVRSTVTSCFMNAGQTCAALTRLLVERSSLGSAEEIAGAAASAYRLGDPFDPATTMGPLISGSQRQRVRQMVNDALEAGARLVCGGTAIPQGLESGFYFHPTVLSDVTQEMEIAREEVFGPVLVIMAYDGVDHAVRIVNDTAYGLGGAVWSADSERALSIAGQIRAGQVDINQAVFNPMAPFGGVKRSGIGREMGRFGLEQFVELKSIQL